ncbi:protein of unknown function [Paraburkholderia dioscoreae]|uniref:Uncharacterized protein n=1 Tax=Paraburkholderia dioscoreae TaxID=2604047 RepID=A0A5Q4Z2F4_9BURK|nr:protein of unknown function [Paraburkholderia dioscoreae]
MKTMDTDRPHVEQKSLHHVGAIKPTLRLVGARAVYLVPQSLPQFQQVGNRATTRHENPFHLSKLLQTYGNRTLVGEARCRSKKPRWKSIVTSSRVPPTPARRTASPSIEHRGKQADFLKRKWDTSAIFRCNSYLLSLMWRGFAARPLNFIFRGRKNLTERSVPG